MKSKWTYEEDALLIIVWRFGGSVKGLAWGLGRTVGACYRRANYLKRRTSLLRMPRKNGGKQ